MLKKIVILTLFGGFGAILPANAQENRVDSMATVIQTTPDTVAKQVLMIDGKPMTERQMKRYYKQMRRDSIR